MKNFVKFFVIIVLVVVVGITSSCTAPDDSDSIKPDEFREVETEGRLEINGLNDYNGHFINAAVTLENRLYLVALEYLANAYLEGEIFGGCESENSTVNNGQATLKVFKEVNANGKVYYDNYNGNDKNVTFKIGVWEDGDINSISGNVTVDFTSGIGSGDFVLYNQ
jgi:hypothetical protein